MIDVELDEQELLIRETAERFAREELLSSVREFEVARSVPDDVCKQYRELGLDGIEVGEEGEGLSGTMRALILDEISAVDPGAAIALDGVGLIRYLLVAAGLEGVGTRGAVVFDEECRFVVEDGHISGQHAWVPASDIDVVAVVQDASVFIVSEGISCESTLPCGLDAAGSSSITLARARVRKTLSRTAEGSESVEQAIARIKLATAAMLAGCARGAYEYARQYACEREAFGRPIAHHQGLAFLIVELRMAVETARLSVWRASVAIDAEEDVRWWGNAALAEAAEQALFVGPAAVQVLGGHGFVRDYPVEKAMRDIRSLAQMAGSRDQAEIELGELARTRDMGLFQ